ncbi:MAG: hypothetical protein ACJ76Y_15530 [Thermoanaerobaculia bacterium]
MKPLLANEPSDPTQTDVGDPKPSGTRIGEVEVPPSPNEATEQKADSKA